MTKTCQVKSAYESVPVTDFSLDKTSLTLLTGEKDTLKVLNVKPSDANTSIAWSSSDESVLTVNKGVLQAVSGYSSEKTVTVTASSGEVVRRCKVTVKGVSEIKYAKSDESRVFFTRYTYTLNGKPEAYPASDYKLKYTVYSGKSGTTELTSVHVSENEDGQMVVTLDSDAPEGVHRICISADDKTLYLPFCVFSNKYFDKHSYTARKKYYGTISMTYHFTPDQKMAPYTGFDDMKEYLYYTNVNVSGPGGIFFKYGTGSKSLDVYHYFQTATSLDDLNYQLAVKDYAGNVQKSSVFDHTFQTSFAGLQARYTNKSGNVIATIEKSEGAESDNLYSFTVYDKVNLDHELCYPYVAVYVNYYGASSEIQSLFVGKCQPKSSYDIQTLTITSQGEPTTEEDKFVTVQVIGGKIK